MPNIKVWISSLGFLLTPRPLRPCPVDIFLLFLVYHTLIKKRGRSTRRREEYLLCPREGTLNLVPVGVGRGKEKKVKACTQQTR